MSRGHRFTQDRVETQKEKIALGIVLPSARTILDLLVYWMESNNAVIVDNQAIQEASDLKKSTVEKGLKYLIDNGFISRYKARSGIYFINPRLYKTSANEDIGFANKWAFNAKVVMSDAEAKSVMKRLESTPQIKDKNLTMKIEELRDAFDDAKGENYLSVPKHTFQQKY